MTLTDFKKLFRKFIVVVAGGPEDRTRGKNLIAIFDALAEALDGKGSGEVQEQHSFELGQLFGIRDSRIVVKAPGGAVSASSTLPTSLEPGSVVTLYGAPYFPSLDYQFPASGTLVLAPGSSLTLKNFRPPSGPFLLCGQGTLVSPVNIGPSAREVTIRDIQLSGYVYAFSYNIFGAMRKLRLDSVRLTNTDARQAAVTVDYGYAQNYYTYLQAEVIGCDITSAGDAIRFFDQFPGAAAGDAQAKATNSLLLLQNRLRVGAGKRVLNDDDGALSFVRGGNHYLDAPLPAQPYAVIAGTDGGGAGGGGTAAQLTTVSYIATVDGAQPPIFNAGAVRYFNVTVAGEEVQDSVDYTDDSAGTLQILASAGVQAGEVVQYCWLTAGGISAGLSPATTTTLGGVIVGPGLAVDGDGTVRLKIDPDTLGLLPDGTLYVLTSSGNVSVAAMPQNVVATASTRTRITTIRWDSVTGASLYQIFRSVNGSGFQQIGIVPYPRLEDYTDNVGQYVRYYVVSANSAGQSPASAIVVASSVA
jgi:hypothetical protein